MINVEVQKTGTENPMSVLKRFTRRVQGAGILPRVRSLRYAKRAESRYVRKKRALKVIARRVTREQQDNAARTMAGRRTDTAKNGYRGPLTRAEASEQALRSLAGR